MSHGNRFYIAPNKGLTIASGAVNGINEGMRNYMNMKMMKSRMALQQEQMRAQAAYRQAQAGALNARYGNQDVDMAKVGTALQIANHPGATPDQVASGQKMAQKYVDQALQNADTPDKQAYIRSKINAYMGGQAPQGAAPSQYGSPGMIQPPPSLDSPTTPQTWSYAERQMFQNAARPNAMVADAGLRTQSDQAIKQMEGENQVRRAQMAYQQAIDLEHAKGSNAQALAKIQGDYKNQVANIAGQYGLDKEDIMGRYRVQAAKASARAHQNTQLTPQQKAGLQQVQGIDAQIKEVEKQQANPFKGLDNMTLSDEQKQAHLNALQQQHDGLQQQKQTLLDGYGLGPVYKPPGSSSGSPVMPGQGSAPAVPGPAQAPSFKQPGASFNIQTDPSKAKIGDYLPDPRGNGFAYPVTKLDSAGPHVDTGRGVHVPSQMAPASAPVTSAPAQPQQSLPSGAPPSNPVSFTPPGQALPPVPAAAVSPNAIPGM